MKKKILAFGLISALFCSTPAMADMNRTTKGALLGAGVGLLTGNGVNGVLKGAAVGAGVGAVTEKGRDGKNARKGAKVGAAVGAVTGVLTGNGLEGAGDAANLLI
ncbi:hypothetical protein [Escherichia coli]|uniref:hypothetical protein n=1 Tax=Escherichia coli TaxID=562 RepID=UPI000BE1933C|nr:hypothetical protein [Escherichia coli]